MTVPLVISTTPTDGATDVTIDSVISFRFNTALDTSTITLGTIILVEEDTLDSIPGIVSYNSDLFTVTFLPRAALSQNTAYKAHVVGFDQSLGAWIKSDDGDALADTYTISFRTTEERYVPLDEVVDRSDIELVGPVRAVAATLPPELAGVLEQAGTPNITITSSTPKGFASQVDVCTDTITLELGYQLVNVDTATDFTLEVYPALGDEAYFADTDSTGTIWLNDTCNPTGYQENSVDITMPDFVSPTGEFSVTGTQLVWTRTADDPCFMYNSEVHVVISEGVEGVADGITGAFEEESEIIFTTEYWPKFIDQRLLRLELGASVRSLYDDTLNRIIHKNSIDAWEQAGGNFDIDDPYPAVKRYVKWCSIIDVMDALTIQGGIIGNTEKMLGDFRVQHGGFKDSMHPKYEKAMDGKEKALRELRWYRGQGRAQVVLPGSTNPAFRADKRERTWDNWYAWTYDGLVYDSLAGSPGANMRDERWSKIIRSHDHHGHRGTYGANRDGSSRTVFRCRSTD